MAGRDEKRFPVWAPWVAGLVGGGLLVGAQLWLVRSNVEDDLTTRAKDALAQLEKDDPVSFAGYSDFDVTFHGRDGVVSGVPGGDSEANSGRGVDAVQVELAVGGLEGVRTVTVETLTAPGEEDAEEAAPGEDAPATPDATDEPSAEPSAAPTEAAPEPTPSASPGTAEGVVEQLSALPQIPFVTGTTEWKNEGNAILAQMKRAILSGPADAVYEVQGHTDSVGDPDANLALSQRRAAAVRNELISRGVPASRLTAVGYGQTKPLVDPEKTDEDRATNRRVVLVVAG